MTGQVGVTETVLKGRWAWRDLQIFLNLYLSAKEIKRKKLIDDKYEDR